jgi:hypothetical protein
LDITFNRTAVNKLLQDNALSLWGSNRAETLIWIAFQSRRIRLTGDFDDHLCQRQGKRLHTALTPLVRHHQIAQALKVASIQWGVPLLFPLLDMEDRRSLPMAEHWGLFPAAVAKASGRFGVGAPPAGVKT